MQRRQPRIVDPSHELQRVYRLGQDPLPTMSRAGCLLGGTSFAPDTAPTLEVVSKWQQIMSQEPDCCAVAVLAGDRTSLSPLSQSPNL
ncbi:unnamed protein product [Ixodes persulcatus]